MLLDQFDKSDQDMFKRDFQNVLVMLLTLQDRLEHYGKDIQDDIEEFKEGLERFDQKYHDLNLRLEGARPSLRFFKIYLKSDSLQQTYNEAIKKMQPLGFARTLTALHSQNTVADIDLISSSLAVMFTEHESLMLRLTNKGVKLIYSIEELLKDKKNPSMDLCVFYALRTKPMRNIKIFSDEFIGKGNYTHQFIPKGSIMRKWMRS